MEIFHYMYHKQNEYDQNIRSQKKMIKAASDILNEKIMLEEVSPKGRQGQEDKMYLKEREANKKLDNILDNAKLLLG